MFLDLKMSPGFPWKMTVCNTARFLATDNKTLEKDVFWLAHGYRFTDFKWQLYKNVLKWF